MFLGGSPEDRFYSDGVVVGALNAKKVRSLRMSVDREMDHQGT